MYAVIFEVMPEPERRQDYLDIAAKLRPELEKIDGFISIERFESLTQPGKILSLTLRYFPHVVGDGVATLRELIARDPRARWRAGLHLGLDHNHLGCDRAALDRVPAVGELVRLALIASRRAGALCRDASHAITPALEQKIAAVVDTMPEFHYGRFDLRFATMDKLARSKSGQVVSWCPSCHVQFTETTLPTVEKTRGSKPFEMTPFMLFLRGNLDRLRPFLRKPVPMRVALHRHPGLKGVVEAAEDILHAVPGVDLVDLKQPAVGMMSNYFRALPAYRRELQKNELDAAERAGVDALVAVYHADHRELCAHERDYPFRIMNLLEIVGASMGLHRDDHFKRLKMLQDVDAIAADCQDLVAQHGLDPETTRQAIQAMLDEQPLPLRGASL